MGKLIRDDGRGVNFQKASCTLDASVKIYSHRVDDTHASGHRILESLSRNGNNAADGEDEAVEGGERRRHANRHVSSDTIERNVDSINSASMDDTQSTDPMFHKMSKAFDEGGARGMLMNNMVSLSFFNAITAQLTGIYTAHQQDFL
jgi:condensin complex subunit 2